MPCSLGRAPYHILPNKTSCFHRFLRKKETGLGTSAIKITLRDKLGSEAMKCGEGRTHVWDASNLLGLFYFYAKQGEPEERRRNETKMNVSIDLVGTYFVKTECDNASYEMEIIQLKCFTPPVCLWRQLLEILRDFRWDFWVGFSGIFCWNPVRFQ